ncbi:DUF58 domain-containing protein [Moritella viscosa]|uniref:Uncharacterized protein containing a von Willebrand factor type A(VWA) domain n=1 Tax=Moritella viscosa TaxID=80854 RepID=A0ABY1H8V5_9GAMM|nr:DUF58 domain-containing protein [Moritella viscosa]SGY86013.1 Uncharacterized protein containing a von Willebrand factor type A(VWA) domain [Moritella viscosa]SGY87330.1 Uncharacterized protein containing a von Willebrand factor type A(VWA) domain [Moritella viscosa]SGY89368.1 Uncharacterized protein containing a von Willebrand factor type A(VWA) domain [Moritella viscosa]SHO24872.1 Uncharacterized protein containing a von Willebrand factor type A(VWA) domain [Moritella viscosa]
MSAIDVSIKELQQYSYQTNSLLASKTLAKARLAGGHLSPIKGRGMEFSECRQYQPGDDIRSIDWRITARTGKTYSKLFSEEKERPVYVLLDLSSSMYFGSQYRLKSVQACHLTALLAWATKHKSDRVGGIIIGNFGHKELKPQRQQRGIMQLLSETVTLHNAQLTMSQTVSVDATNNMNTEPKESLTSALTRLRLLCKTGSHIMIISDFLHLDDKAQKQLALLKRHNEVEAWQIYDPLELSLPSISGDVRLAVSNGQQHGFVNPSNAICRQKYQQHADMKQQALRKIMNRYGIRHHRISSGESLLSQIKGQG